MDCVKHEQDPQSLTEIKSEPTVSYKIFILCYILITLMIDILKHISIVVLQDVESEIKTEAEEWEHIYIKHEQDVTHDNVASVKCLLEVSDSVLLCLFIYLL